MFHVFLTDGQQRKTLAAMRSLGQKGLRISAGETTRFATALFSKYCTKSFLYPDPNNKDEEFLWWLKRTLNKYPCQVLFPMDDSTMDIIINHREELAGLCRLPLPPLESYLLAVDKGKAIIAAQKAGLNCPKTIMVSDIDRIEILIKDMDFPLVIKPRISSGSRGIRVANNMTELTELYARIHKVFPYPLIQEYIPPGDRYDVCLIFNKRAQPRAAFVQKEIRHFPLEMGPSTVQESVIDTQLVEQTISLIQQIGWYGIVEVEFMVNKSDGKLVFMEINPRFWASLQMSILAGIDFPWLLYQLAMNEDIKEELSYIEGIKCRWLFPGDMLHFLTNPQRLKMNPSFLAGKKRQVHDDIVSLNDPLPTMGVILACLRYLPDKKMWHFMFRR